MKKMTVGEVVEHSIKLDQVISHGFKSLAEINEANELLGRGNSVERTVKVLQEKQGSRSSTG